MNDIYICVNIESSNRIGFEEHDFPFGTVTCDNSKCFSFKVAKNLFLNSNTEAEMDLSPFKIYIGLQTQEWKSKQRFKNIKSPLSLKMASHRLAERYCHRSNSLPEALGVVGFSWIYVHEPDMM